mgnify:CR=1 FL=1
MDVSPNLQHHLAPAPVKFSTRWMVRVDMADVLAIDRLAFEDSWPEEKFLKCLRQRNLIGMVCDHGETVVGYCIYELEKTNFDIARIAVHKKWWRLGAGRYMIGRLVGKIANGPSSVRRTSMTMHVRERNLDGQLFLKAMGFKGVKVKRRYFRNDTDEDAFVMRYDFGNFDQFATEVKT